MKWYLNAMAAAVLVAACQKSTDKTESARKDIAETQTDMQKEQAEANKEMTEAQRDADKKKMEAQKDLTEEQREDQKKIADKQKELNGAERDRMAEAGTPVTVTGKVSDIGRDMVEVKTSAGEDLKLHVSGAGQAGAGTPSISSIHEGDEVRASYKVQGDDKVIQHIEVLNQKNLNKDLNKDLNRDVPLDRTQP